MQIRAFLLAESVTRASDGRFSLARIVSNYRFAALPAALPPLWAFLSLPARETALRVRPLLCHPDQRVDWLSPWIDCPAAPGALAQEWGWALERLPLHVTGIATVLLMRELDDSDPNAGSLTALARFRFVVTADASPPEDSG